MVVEDVGIEALIAEVVADPKPERVSCQPLDPPTAVDPPPRRSLRELAATTLRRITRRS